MPVLEPGQRLGAYVVADLLGRGGMAEVYHGTHTALERGVAIKVLNPSFNADPTFPLRFLREAKIVARLNHPNVITIYDFGERGELAYLVMELASGGSFKERAAELRTLAEVVDALAPIVDALQYAHDRGIVHRDLKPENVLMTGAPLPPAPSAAREGGARSTAVESHPPPLRGEGGWLGANATGEAGTAKLADFGLAHIASETLNITEAGMILGSPLYMAPEQALAQPVDRRADIYALGVLCYELVTGDVPFRGGTFFATVQQHLKAPPPSIRAVAPDAPPALDAALRKAMAKRPEERFESAAAYFAELRRAAAEASAMPVGAYLKAAQAQAAQPSPASGNRPSRRSSPLQGEGARSESGLPSPAPAGEGSGVRATSTPNLNAGGFCGACGAPMRAGDRFCRSCGTLRAVAPQMPVAGDAFDDRTTVLPLEEMLDEPPADAAVPPLDFGAEQSPRLSVGRRATSFNEFQWLVLGTVVVIGVFINAVGLWLARAGRAAGEQNVAAGVTTYIFDNLQAFKSAFTGLAVVLAALAVFSMRAAIIDNHNLPLAMYVKLRRYHRLVGYGAGVLALAVGLLTCVGIFGFGTDSPRSVLHSMLGTALLVALVAKIAVVRYFPSQRRYLQLLGEGVLVLFILVFASSALPFLWEHVTGATNGYYHGR